MYLLDANIFIQAKNTYYAFDICPGFWDSLLGAFDDGVVCSIAPVRDELKVGKDEIADWMNKKVPKGFFHSVKSPADIEQYREVMKWVQTNSQFFQPAKDDFAAGADGWLVAYAAVHGMWLVTQEQIDPQAKKRVPLPNVAEAFEVHWLNTFEMLRALGIEYTWLRK